MRPTVPLVPLVPLAPTVALVPLFQLFHSFHSPGTLPATHSFRLQCEWRAAELASGASGAGDFNSSPPPLCSRTVLGAPMNQCSHRSTRSTRPVPYLFHSFRLPRVTQVARVGEWGEWRRRL